MDFEKDLREQIIRTLKENKINFNKNCSTKQLLICYLNAYSRFIDAKPRKVYKSDKIKQILEENKIDGQNHNEENEAINALKEFEVKFENGDDMTGHLSTGIFESYLFNRDGDISKNMKSRDYLLAEWGIHHLHLNVNEAKSKEEMKNPNGNRSPYLLFVKVKEDSIYFIDVKKHVSDSFCKPELLNILDRNWHHLIKKHLWPDQTIIIPEMTDEEIYENRKKNGFIPYNINGKIYGPPGGGVTSAGTNVSHTTEAGNVIMAIRELENKYKFQGIEAKLILTEEGYSIATINKGK